MANDKQSLKTAVENVLDGKTADGSARLSATPSFTKNPAARAQASNLIDELTSALLAYGFELSSSRLDAVIAKTLSYLSKSGRQTPRDIAETLTQVTHIAAAIAANPDRLADNTGLAGIVCAYNQQLSQEAARAIAIIPEKPEHRPVLWSDDRHAITVTETSHPDHLKEDSLSLLHCAGNDYHKDALRRRGLKPGQPGSEAYLRYWRAIAQKRSRVFTVHVDGAIRFTLEYDPATRDIVQISGRLRKGWASDNHLTPPTNDVAFDDPLIPQLCRALSGIRGSVPLKAIIGLPPTYRGTVRTPDGAIQAISRANVGTALSGTLTVMPGLDPDAVALAADNPGITFCLDQQRDARHVPPAIEGWLLVEDFDDAKIAVLRHGNVAYYGTSLSLPRLEQGRIEAPNLKALNAPLLQAAYR